MAGEDGDGVDVRVVDDLVIAGRGILESEFFTGVLGMESTCGGDADEFYTGCLLYRWK